MLDARRVAEHVRAQTDVSMGKNFEEKMAIVGAVKERLSSSQLIFSTQANGMTMKQVNDIRTTMPEGTTVMMVKNRMFKRAVGNSQFEVAKPTAVSSSNMWIFVDSDIKGSISAFKDWKKKYKKETGINNGVLDGNLYDDKQME
ncbi:hypothetical protein T484DRAFT_2104034 [Baffinella frigidus]|nr:hypothetical protein T484DRAFT_2104034 [Cryptophyta sp. CCMP2293]